jgi:RNA polymerase sigma factor (sigma-70 family)
LDEPSSVERLWEEFKLKASADARERLILHYAPLVKYVAGRVSVGLPPTIEQADLVSYGIFGLIDAIEKYDLERGIKFETYAISRIKGAIIDELRAIDWIPRSARFKAREVEKAYVALENRLHRSPTDAEVAQQLGITTDELHQIFNQISFVSVVALDELLSVGSERGDRLSLVDTLDKGRRGPGGGLRIPGDEGHPGRRHQPARRAREDRDHPLLLRGPHPGRDRAGPGGHRVAGLPDAHQGGPPAPGQDAGRPLRRPETAVHNFVEAGSRGIPSR